MTLNWSFLYRRKVRDRKYRHFTLHFASASQTETEKSTMQKVAFIKVSESDKVV